MVYAGRVLLALTMVVASVVARPNHLKAVVVDTDPIPQKEVSVSFGGYSANAGLGGSASGGGLSASASSPHGSAGAGLGGGVGGGDIGASASSGSSGSHSVSHGGHGGQKPGPFDGIFNIPISVLQSVNSYLNNRGPVTKAHRRRGHPDVVKTITPVQAGDEVAYDKEDTSASAGSSVESSASASASASASGAGHKPVVINKRVNYDDIFNIPISALRAVNQMLNGKK